jgi:hypothetical protein
MSTATIESGTHVEWEGKSGRVDLVVSSGIVPGVEGEHTGTADEPIARVVVGEEKVAVKVSALTAVDPEPEYKGEAAALVGLLAEHSRKAEGKGASATLSPEAVQTAFERGLHEWPGEDVTGLTADQWAVGRVAHLSKAALAPEVAQTQGLNDADLLDPSNPAYVAPASDPAADPAAGDAGTPKIGTGLSGSADPAAPAPSTAPPGRPQPTLDSLDFTGQDPEDPDGDEPAQPGDGQADPGGDAGPDGSPDAPDDSTTVSAAQLQEMLGDWTDATDDAGTGTDET